MLPLTIATYSLLGTGLVFAIIELGLTAYGLSYWDGNTYACGENYDGYEVTVTYCKTTAPAIISFLVFTSLWTMLATPFALVYPWYQARRADVSHENLNKWLAPVFIVLFFLTFVFWLAGFADIAYLTGGLVGDIDAAILAFGVLNWLIYMALFILAILTVVNVVPHDLPGWQPLTTRSGPGTTDAPGTYNSGAPTYNAVPVAEHHIINEEPKNNGAPEMVA